MVVAGTVEVKVSVTEGKEFMVDGVDGILVGIEVVDSKVVKSGCVIETVDSVSS